jgi:hypothetical protein
MAITIINTNDNRNRGICVVRQSLSPGSFSNIHLQS